MFISFSNSSMPPTSSNSCNTGPKQSAIQNAHGSGIFQAKQDFLKGSSPSVLGTAHMAHHWIYLNDGSIDDKLRTMLKNIAVEIPAHDVISRFCQTVPSLKVNWIDETRYPNWHFSTHKLVSFNIAIYYYIRHSEYNLDKYQIRWVKIQTGLVRAWSLDWWRVGPMRYSNCYLSNGDRYLSLELNISVYIFLTKLSFILIRSSELR